MADVQEAEMHFLMNLSLSLEAPHDDPLFLLDSVIVLNLQLCILTLVCGHTVTISRNEVVLFCKLIHFKLLKCINVKMQSIYSLYLLTYLCF